MNTKQLFLTYLATGQPQTITFTPSGYDQDPVTYEITGETIEQIFHNEFSNHDCTELCKKYANKTEH